MSEPFIGEIRLWACNFKPRGWLECTGSEVPISEFQALYSVVGTTYGGNGVSTFALPNLQGRAPMHWGTGPGLSPKLAGQLGGHEAVSLATTSMPSHNHALRGRQTNGSKDDPQDAYLARDVVKVGPIEQPQDIYGPATSLRQMSDKAIGSAGSSSPHENRQPFLTLRFCIAYEGIYPPRNGS